MAIISEETINALNVQLNEENYSSHLYFNMAGWAAKNGLSGASAFLEAHAKEEHKHLELFSDFIKKVGGQPIVSAMKAPESSFNSIEDIFYKIMEHEQYITFCIKKLVNKAMDDKDYITLKFLDCFIEEQVEEEALFSSIIDKIKMLGELKGRDLYMFDSYLSSISSH